MVEVWSKLNLSSEVEKVLLSARSYKFLQRQINEFFLVRKICQLKSFIEKDFIKIDNSLHGVTIGRLASEAIDLKY